VIETKKALAEHSAVLVKVDNIVAVQNLEKMAKGYGCEFYYTVGADGCFDVTIMAAGHIAPIPEVSTMTLGVLGLGIVIGRSTMGEGSEELGKILIKGFIYSLTELPTPPEFLIFFNSGAYLTADGANTIDDLKKLEARGTQILTCGTCINFYGLDLSPAAGSITDMYGITEKMAAAANLINI